MTTDTDIGMTKALEAAAILGDYYGDAYIQPPDSDGTRKVVGVDEDENERARWLVSSDGKVRNAWDPDRLLERFEP